MKQNASLLFVWIFTLVGLAACNLSYAQELPEDSISVRKDFSLPNPMHYEAFYDVTSGMYLLYPKVGNVVAGAPVAMTPEEYGRYESSLRIAKYYREKSEQSSLLYRKDPGEELDKSLIPIITIKNRLFEKLFGSNKIELIPQGYAAFDLGVLLQKIDNPLVLPQNRKSFAIDLQQRIQLGIIGKVGDNLQLKANYDTQSGFAFENRLNLLWQAQGTWRDLQSKGFENSNGNEDKIIKRVEFGNVNMPLSTSLIRGSQSLFGLKTEFELGKTKGVAVFSQQQGEARHIVAQGGGVMNTFKINAIDYDENQHYYLGQYFYKNYDRALLNYPTISSLVNITRLEVWVVEQGSANLQSQKSVVALRDLGEGLSGYPDNTQSGVYSAVSTLPGIRDYNSAYDAIKGKLLPAVDGGALHTEAYVDGENFIFNRRAKLLSRNEYRFNPQLGYISLNQRLNDNQMLAVSFSFTVNGSDRVYKVGEFSEESPLLLVKLLKPNVSLKTSSPMWQLMMKNIYSVNAAQLDSDGFILNVLYKDPQNGRVNYLPGTSVQDTNLLRLLNWDRLNQNMDVQQNSGSGANGTGDGIFDYVPGITVDPQYGRVIFTKAEPFGSYINSVLGGTNDPKFVFDELYTQQKQKASQNNLAQRYMLEGRFKGSMGSGISLGAINVPQGSVKVTANGQELIEGSDYTVDYMLGTVNIINERVKNSGQAIDISMENQMTFNTQRKRFLGLDLERKFSDNLTVGATVVNYSEIPLTQKVQLGSESVNNTMAGFNLMYNNEVPFLTRLVNKIPLIKTEAPSNLNFRMEAAYLLPGTNKAMDNQSYIDDFEQTSSKISLKDPAFWSLASKPELNPNDPVFQYAGLNDDLRSGYGRALLSWYYIDPRFYGLGGRTPAGINAQSVSNHTSRRVQLTELFNQRDVVPGEQTYINTLNISYYPQDKGPYNFNPSSESTAQRWAGMMRALNVTNFTESNIEYLEFWLQDPYADGGNLGADPKLRFHLGNVSEDILKDGKLGYENGLPTAENPTGTTSSNWGVQPAQFPVLYAFGSDNARTAQDLGLDGLNNADEAAKFGLNHVNPVTGENDPASDDFVFPLSNQFQGTMAGSVIDRYRYFRGPEGNSSGNSLEVATQTPDAEDINQDFNLDLTEDYNQYTVSLKKSDLAVGKNFISDAKEVNVRFKNGQTDKVTWYQFKIPVSQFDFDGGSHDAAILNNVRFMRMLLTGFDEVSTLRFGTMDLVRSDWRKYTRNFANSFNQDEGTVEVDNSNFEIGSVNLEENSAGTPPYVLPPGIRREVLTGTTGNQQQNESSLYMKAMALTDEARGVFKNTMMDMRRFNKLELFVHAENLRDLSSNQTDPNAKFFIRMGSDATDNYYEYEIPLTYTPSTARAPLEIWPLDNTISLEIQNLVDAKLRRDELGVPIDQRFSDPDVPQIITKGRPSLGNITTLVLGVRNESSISKDLLLWVNEMRLTGVDNKGGYAANASLDFNLGDFATVNANMAITTIGFGSIEQTPVERAQSDNVAYNINTTVNVDKFLPEKIGMKIPVNYSYSQNYEDPKYNPLDDDVELRHDPNAAAAKKVVRTFSQQRSLSIINMHKDRMKPESKPKFYDVENLSFTGIYDDDYYRDIYTKKNYRQNLKASLDYNFTFKPWVVQPFNKLVSDTAKSYKYLRWAKEFNFNIVPTRVSFRTDIDRSYSEMQFRNVEALLAGVPGDDFESIRNRNFYFGWQYNVGFNFTKSLKLDITSATRTLNDHADVNAMNNRSIFRDLFTTGRPVLYNHRVQLNYKLPFEYLPYLDFVRAEAAYGFTYNWSARSTAMTDFIDPEGNQVNLGNLAQNNNTKMVTGTMDFPSFLKKFKGFRKIDSIQAGRRRELDSIRRVYTELENNPRRRNTKFKAHKFKYKLSPVQAVLNSLTSIRQVDFNYNENNSTALPGILSSPNFYGYGGAAGGPTLGFLFGSQADIRRIAVERHWLSDSPYMTDAYTQMKNQEIRGNVEIQPLNDLRINLQLLRTYTRNFIHGGYNIDVLADDPSNPASLGYQPSFAQDMITYSYSTWSFKTAFKNGQSIFADMLEKGRQMSAQLGTNPGANGYRDGYGISNAYVLVPAFKAALEGKSPKAVGNPTKIRFPLPNWQITYSGLTNIPMIASKFSKLDLLHNYTSTYTATDIQSNIDYYNLQNGNAATDRDLNNDFLNPYVFNQVTYIESFAPLLGADMTLRNNMQIRAMYNRDRMFLLGLKNATLTEDSANEYVLGFGYIIKDFKMRLRSKGRVRDVRSDLNIRGDFSLRDNKTTITNILLEDSQVTGGQRIMTLKLSADYNVSQNFNFKIFYDQMMSRYKISTAYPLSTVRAGITATFNFGGGGMR